MIYDAKKVTELLGLPCDEEIAIPGITPNADEILVYYGGWDCSDLRLSKGQAWFADQWWNQHANKWRRPNGYYLICLTIAGTNNRSYRLQVQNLAEQKQNWEVGSFCIVCTALLLELITKRWQTDYQRFRCQEESQPGYHVVVDFMHNKIGYDVEWHVAGGARLIMPGMKHLTSA